MDTALVVHTLNAGEYCGQRNSVADRPPTLTDVDYVTGHLTLYTVYAVRTA